MKIIFDSEEEKENFCREFCPSYIGMRDSCPRIGYGGECTKCWESVVDCEVKNTSAKPQMVILEKVPDNCNHCPCFGHESGICQVTGQQYDGTERPNKCPIKE